MTTLPPKPRDRSSRAHSADATPPPMSRTSTSATGELRRDALLEPGVEHEQHLVAGLDDRVGLGHEAAAVAQHRDDQRPLGQRHVSDLLPVRGRAARHLELDDLQALLLEREQVHQAVARHLVLDEPQDEVGGAHRRLDAQQLEVLQVPRVVDAGDDALDEVLLLGHLAHEDVVLVVARHRDHEVGALDARPLEHPQLRRVAVLHRVLELLLDDQVAAPVALDERDLLALVDELAGQVPADLASADDQDVHQLSRSRAWRNMSMAPCVGEIVSMPCSAYQAARAGSMTRHSTRATSKRRWAIWPMTMLVLAPSVAATKQSARSSPASSGASTSSAVPTLNSPPRASHVPTSPTSRRSCESGSSSRTETSWPADRAARATADPTRPAPTMSTNIGAGRYRMDARTTPRASRRPRRRRRSTAAR